MDEAEERRALGEALVNIMLLVVMGDISGEVPSWNMPGLSDYALYVSLARTLPSCIALTTGDC